MDWTEEEIEFMKVNYLKMTRQEIGKHLGRSEPSIRSYCYRYGLNTKKEPNWTVEEEQKLIEVYKWYSVMVLDLHYVALLFGRSRGSIASKANQLGITDNSRKMIGGRVSRSKFGKNDEWRIWSQVQKTKKRWHDNGHPRGMLGKHHTEETKAILSQSSIQYNAALSEEEKRGRGEKSLQTRMRRYGTMGPVNVSNPYSGARGGKRQDLNNMYFRSNWEANYARYLNWLKDLGEITEWEYEPDEFWFEGIKRGARSYIPDFKITEKNGSTIYHEIKGWMDKKSATKLKRMTKFYPHIDVVVIGEDEYRAISRQVKNIVPNWELTKGHSY